MQTKEAPKVWVSVATPYWLTTFRTEGGHYVNTLETSFEPSPALVAGWEEVYKASATVTQGTPVVGGYWKQTN